MNAFPAPVPEHPDDLVIDVDIRIATGAGNEIGEVQRRVVVPVALHPMWLDRAEGSAMFAIEREALIHVSLAIVKEIERRRPEGFFRRLDTLHPDFMPTPDIEEERRFAQFAEHVVNELEIASED